MQYEFDRILNLHLCTERPNSNRAKEKLPEQAFADAVMNISNGGLQMDR